ncbi:MAG: nickel-dependent lactate racemase [Dethiobacteria bacterium]
MKADFLYGDHSLAFDLPEEQVIAVLEAKPLPTGKSEEKLIREALAKPIGSPRLSELVSMGEKVVIVIGDMTRQWVRHDRFLPFLLNELNRGGVTDQDIAVISATGDHREQTPEEHSILAGKEVCRRVKIHDHSSTAEDELVYLGVTSFGTPVRINRRIVECDRVIVTGGIVYHFLAGWGGGKKAIIPGVSARDTIMANHSLAFLPGEGKGLNPAVSSGRMKGNPCSEDMVEGALMAAPDFLLNTVIDETNGRIAGVFAGDFIRAHEEGCRFVDSHFRVSIDKKADLVIASCGGYPKDINFYQTYKTIYNAHKAMRPGGTILLISESREGVGSDPFFRMFTDFKNNKARENYLRKNYTIGGQMAYHSAVIAEENDILLISDLPDDTVRAMGMVPVSAPSEALNWAGKKHGEQMTISLMPHGGSTLPG